MSDISNLSKLHLYETEPLHIQRLIDWLVLNV